jgi:CO/xanthine dehydrogenase Mo-binding subunit
MTPNSISGQGVDMGVSTLGKPIPQVNALAKVLGRSQYAGDIHLPGMLHGKVLRSPHAHARIVHINIEAALALPGVKAVVTGAQASSWRKM